MLVKPVVGTASEIIREGTLTFFRFQVQGEGAARACQTRRSQRHVIIPSPYSRALSVTCA